jgi:hypothetical protein
MMLELMIALLIAIQGNYACDTGIDLVYEGVVWKRVEFTVDYYTWAEQYETEPLIVAEVQMPRLPDDFEDYEKVNLQDYRDEIFWLEQDAEGRIAAFIFDPDNMPHGCVYFVERVDE